MYFFCFTANEDLLNWLARQYWNVIDLNFDRDTG